MLTLLSTSRTRYLAALFVVIALGVLTGVTVSRARREKSQSNTPTVVSRASAVQVTAVNPMTLANTSALSVKLQNVSGKDIKMLTISVGKTWVTRNYLFGEESFAAGSTVDDLISLSENARGEIVIAAVLFSDGTGDGEQRHLRLLVEKRNGIRDQAKRILPKLRRLSSGSQQALADLESETLNSPTRLDGSSDYQEGLESTRTILLQRIREIKERRLSNKIDDAKAKEEKLLRVFEPLAFHRF
jgi:hypothetical protein